MVWLIKVGEYPAICSGPPFHMQEQFGTGLTKAGCGGVALEQGGMDWQAQVCEYPAMLVDLLPQVTVVWDRFD